MEDNKIQIEVEVTGGAYTFQGKTYAWNEPPECFRPGIDRFIVNGVDMLGDPRDG